MAKKITYEDKEVAPVGSTLDKHLITAVNMNEIKGAINENADELANKAGLDENKKVPLALLYDVLLSPDQFHVLPDGFIGIKSEYLASLGLGGGGQASPEAWMKAQPGYDPLELKLWYSDFTWGPIPAGDMEQIETPVLTKGAVAVDSLPLSWNAVFGATSYRLERASSVAFTNPVTVYNGANLSFTDINLIAATQYFYRLKATGAGFAASAYAQTNATTLATGKVTPPAPTNPVTNDFANTFDFSFSPGIVELSRYRYSVDGGTNYQVVTVKPVPIGNVTKEPGQILVLVAETSENNASGPLYNTVGFTITNLTPGVPTNAVVDDANDVFTVALPASPPNLIATDLETSIDNKVTWTRNSSLSFPVGNENYAAGTVSTRVRADAAAGRNVGPAVSNPTAFTKSVVGVETYVTAPVVTTNTVWSAADHSITVTTATAVQFAKFKEYLPSGQEGYLIAKEEGVALSFQNNKSDGWVNNATFALSRNPSNGKIEAVFGGNYYTLGSVMSAVTLKVTFLTSTMLCQYSTDNGVTWTGDQSIPRPSGVNYYFRVNNSNNVVSSKISNIRYVGFISDETIIN